MSPVEKLVLSAICWTLIIFTVAAYKLTITICDAAEVKNTILNSEKKLKGTDEHPNTVDKGDHYE